MDINLKYVAAVTSKRGPHFPQPLAEHSYQSYLNNILYANSNGYAIHNNKGDQVSSIAASWAIYHHMIMGPPEGSILIAQMVIKLGLSTTKIKYITGIYMISQNVYHLCFAASFMSMWAQSKSERVH